MKGVLNMNIKMKLTETEIKGMEIFGLKEDFTYEELKSAYNKVINNKYEKAMFSKYDYTVDNIEDTLKRTYEVLNLYLCKRDYYEEMIDWYFKDIEKLDSPNEYSFTINKNTSYLLDKNVIDDVTLYLNTLFKRLHSFNNALSVCTNENQIKKVFTDYVVIIEHDIKAFKTGELGSRARMLNSFKEKIDVNLEKGSKDYQEMTNYFVNLFGIKGYENFVRVYDLGVAEINKRIYANDLEEKKSIKK